VATIADVLQARTTVSQRRFDVESARGQIETTRGALATSLGVPATVPVDVTDLPDGLRSRGDARCRRADRRAAAERPDLAAARSRAASLWSKARSLKAGTLPTLSGNAAYSRSYYQGPTRRRPSADNTSAGLLLRWPVFTGFQKTYDARGRRRTRGPRTPSARASRSSRPPDLVRLLLGPDGGAEDPGRQGPPRERPGIGGGGRWAGTRRGREHPRPARRRVGPGRARSTDVQARASFLVTLAQLAHDTGALSLASIPQLKKDVP